MERYYFDPADHQEIYAVPVELGGTGVNNIDQAADALGLLKLSGLSRENESLVSVGLS